MDTNLYYTFCILLTLLILVGIWCMAKVKTARLGNLLSSFSMLAAIILTVIYYDVFTIMEVIIIVLVAILLGSIVGLVMAKRVKMIQMPEMVALLNGIGGASSTLIGVATLLQPVGLFEQITAILAMVIGMITLTGSLIAAGKLAKWIQGRPIILKYHSAVNVLNILLVILTSVLFVLYQEPWYLVAILFFSGLFGITFSIRVGGADMPITISLLNSLSGVAGAIAGMAINDILLVAVGGIVGSSGLVLTQIMCHAMNRSLLDIILGKTSISGTLNDTPKVVEVKEEIEFEEIDPIRVLKDAKKVIIVPGYGMALAQAQESLKELASLLENNGAQVKYAIHPVAGRMPGHMNVLLAEVDVDYDQLFEMEQINEEFKECDVCLVVGANDVLNPAARNAPGTPIYGMPILNVDQAKQVIICNFDTKPGYAGVGNPLYHRKQNIHLFLGDAKDSLHKIIDAFKSL